jgi:hypothetical protein
LIVPVDVTVTKDDTFACALIVNDKTTNNSITAKNRKTCFLDMFICAQLRLCVLIFPAGLRRVYLLVLRFLQAPSSIAPNEHIVVY